MSQHWISSNRTCFSVNSKNPELRAVPCVVKWEQRTSRLDTNVKITFHSSFPDLSSTCDLWNEMRMLMGCFGFLFIPPHPDWCRKFNTGVS